MIDDKLRENIWNIIGDMNYLEDNENRLKNIIDGYDVIRDTLKELKDECDRLEKENEKLKCELEASKKPDTLIKQWLNIQYGTYQKECVGEYMCDPSRMIVTRRYNGRIEYYKLHSIEIDYEPQSTPEKFEYNPIAQEVIRFTPLEKQYFRLYKKEDK